MGIEADSRLWHSTPQDQRKDGERDRAAAAVGWTTIRIKWLDLEEQPAKMAWRLGALAEAA